jgi:NAD(P)-dependent dehydrogenase (short-subunit alcohol dehydrogenase family)
MDKAQDALAQIQAEIPDARAEVMQLNLASLKSVHHFAETFIEKHDRLDVLVNNAGVMWCPYATTEDGFEIHFGTNYLGHFALTGLLIDLLRKTIDSRVVNVGSLVHRMGKMDFNNLMYDKDIGYSPKRAHSRSKLAILLFTYELQHRFKEAGANAIAVAAHPGGANTNLTRYIGSKWYIRLFKPILVRLTTQSAAMGALPTIRAAVDPDVTGGQYYGPKGFLQLRGHPVVVNSNKASHNMADAQRLWRVSEQLTGVCY